MAHPATRVKLVFTRTILLEVPECLMENITENEFKAKFFRVPEPLHFEHNGLLGTISPIVMTEALFVVPEGVPSYEEATTTV